VRYKLGFYIPEDTILHSHRSENLKSYIMDIVRSENWGIPSTGTRFALNAVLSSRGFLSITLSGSQTLELDGTKTGEWERIWKVAAEA
jgi:hypothetical protein